MIQIAAFTRVADSLRREIEQELMSLGLLCRVFGRGKSLVSLRAKLESTPGKYTPGGKLVQDAIGLRVVVYFPEDVQIVERILRLKFECDDLSSNIDRPTDSVFSVSRYNLIFRLPSAYFRDVEAPSAELPVDRAFEVQIRTILSEGWHEVEHDLRYKRKHDWVEHDDLSRGLNGVVATLETAEWSMRKIFDDLAYKQYKSRKWDAMLHSSLRMRISSPLTSNVENYIDENKDVARKIIRIKRADVFYALFKLAPRIPLTADNLVFTWNRISIKDESLTRLTPRIILETMDSSNV
jgi:ppGpp synthetase/RelA/SpoT-type nucleotidyltranferase